MPTYYVCWFNIISGSSGSVPFDTYRAADTYARRFGPTIDWTIESR